MDRISSLPDEIVCNILSFLSTKEAVLTSLLSKRWRKLFVFSPSLRFGIQDFSDSDIPSFIDILDRSLAVSGNFPLKNFSLKYRKNVDSDHINRWICNVLSRGVLERLHLDVPAQPKTSLPLEVFTCKTLVTLQLAGGFVIPMAPENASLPALKCLHLGSIQFTNPRVCGIEALLSACPVLEELLMLYVFLETVDERNCTVLCPSLRRLTLNWPNSHNLTFDTPSLAYLDYSHCCQAMYPDFDLDSLVEAKLQLEPSVHSPNTNPKNLIMGLKNVKVLNLSTFRTLEILYTFREAIPVFKNLYHLSIATDYNNCCRALPLLLKNAPNLETLSIKGPFICKCSSPYSCLLTCCVKVLEITFYGKSILELGRLEHILEKLSCLELVKVRSWETDENEKLRLTTDLLNLPRSSKCKIQLEFISPIWFCIQNLPETQSNG